jgi:ElaB/YqjD/DUF883 family membrane-anchored ribosome-binding protein
MDATDTNEVAKGKVMRDLKEVISGAEELLRVTANNAGAEYTATKHKLEKSMHAARDELDRLEHAALLRAKQAARATDMYVHDHPWQSIGVGAALGLVIGVLIGRR